MAGNVTLLPAEVPAHAATVSERPELLLLDDSPGHREAMTQILGADYTVRCAASIPEALSILELHDVGVIVSEAVVGGQSAGELLRVLKQHYPSITTVMLINGAQIYRFATNPALVSRHRVAKSKEPENEVLVNSVVKSLGSLRSRLARLIRRR